MPHEVSMWEDLSDFAETVKRAYRCDVWATQPTYVECWVEKDAMSGIFRGVLDEYGVTLNVGRGYDGWDSIHNAATRYKAHKNVSVLYFGDLDPSGEDMFRSLTERLGEFGAYPEIVKCALNIEDVERYDLPPNPTKMTDTRAPGFIEKYGDISSVELDAMPMDVLRERIKDEVEERMDLDALATVQQQEEEERVQLVELLSNT